MIKTGNINIQEIAETIKKKFSPEKIILFGSYAYGNPSQNSDVYLLIIVNTDLSPRKLAIKIRKELSQEIPFDIVVRTPEQINERLAMSDFFIHHVINKGITL